LLRSKPERPVIFGQLAAGFLYSLEKRPAKIRVSWTGIYGDSGARFQTYYLWKGEYVQAQLTASPEAYRRLSTSREIFRAPKWLTVGTGGYCQTTAVAFDHRTILPPFLPVLRGEDIAFGKTLLACFPSSLTGYLPWAVLHAPLDFRSNSAEDIPLAGNNTSFLKILEALIETFPVSEYVRDEAQSLRILGDHLCAIGRLSAAQFEEIVFTRLWQEITRRLDNFQRRIDSSVNAPPYWTKDIRTFMKALGGKLSSDGLRQSLLVLESEAAAQQRLALAQRLIVRFGNLLKAWPVLIEAARDLKSRGITLARAP
jgi:hypothetical protein